MAQNDLGTKLFFQDKANFASVANGLLNDGEDVIQPNDVMEFHETVIRKDNAVLGKLIEGRRDIARVVKLVGETVLEFILVGIENQTSVDYGMPVRTMGYDVGDYQEQLENPIEGGFRPVITFVLYYGETRWTGPKSLREMLDISDEAFEKIKPYFNDYKLNLIELGFMTNEEIQKLKGAFRLLASVCTYAAGKRYDVHDELSDDPEKTTRLFKQLAYDVPEEFIDQCCKKGANVSSFIKNYGDRSREDGEKKGRLTTLQEMIEKMLRKGLSLEQISSLTELPPEEISKIRRYVPTIG